MEIATAPSTPENAKTTPVIRRAFTVPSKLAGFTRVSKVASDAVVRGADTLFAHSHCKIISFNSGSKRPTSAGRDDDDSKEPIGTLPWATTTERTIAAGPLRIYRVLEVAFLNSGSTLRPILAKSQCWCVDGESKFVLKIGHDSYYRIELPNTNAEENEKVEELKKVLANLLQYEVTPCPFKRGFTVELPEKPSMPVKKRPWKPRQRSHPVNVPSEELGLEDRESQAETVFPRSAVLQEDETRQAASDASGNTPEHEERPEGHVLTDGDAGDACDGKEKATRIYAGCSSDREPEKPDLLQTPTKPKSLTAGRAITAPPQLTLRTTPPSDSTRGIREQSASLSSSMDSFHSFHSPISPLLPSPPDLTPSSPTLHAYYDDTIEVGRTRDHKSEILDQLSISESARQWVATPTTSGVATMDEPSPPFPQTPTLISDTASQGEDVWSEAVTPSPRTQLRHHRSSLRRTPSPLPAPANLYSPSTRLTGHHLTTAILQKTCSLLLGPPIQLVALMLNIARKIANGSYCGFALGTGDSGQKIPCSWDFSDAEEEEVWEEDDYGVSLGNITTTKSTKAKEVGGSWEID